MARNDTNVCKLCRREGVKLFLKGQRCFSEKCAVNRRNYPPGQHVRPKKGTDYGTQLREKQKCKRIYGVLERQFQHYFSIARRQKGNTGENLLILMERRLDNVLLSLGLAFSRFDARQMVAHGHVHVNGRRLDIPSYLVRAGDEISNVGKEKNSKKAGDAIEKNKGRPPRTGREATPNDNKGRVIQLPKREDVSVELNEQLIVELCSK